jgi:hypothetical protein
MLICVCLRILASSRIPQYDLGRQTPHFLGGSVTHSLSSNGVGSFVGGDTECRRPPYRDGRAACYTLGGGFLSHVVHRGWGWDGHQVLGPGGAALAPWELLHEDLWLNPQATFGLGPTGRSLRAGCRAALGGAGGASGGRHRAIGPMELCHPGLRHGAGGCKDILPGSVTALGCGADWGPSRHRGCQWGSLGDLVIIGCRRVALPWARGGARASWVHVQHRPDGRLDGYRLDPDTPDLGVTGVVHPSICCVLLSRWYLRWVAVVSCICLVFFVSFYSRVPTVIRWMIVLQNSHMIAFCSWLFKLYLIIYLIQIKKNHIFY